MNQAILIIEDEATLAKNMRIYLERDGFEVRVVDSAEAGLALLDIFRPDAVILDFNLPGMDGIEAIEQLRARAPEAQIIMVTGHGNVELAVEAMKRGAFDFLTKPVPLSKLRMLLEKAFGEVHRDSALAYYQQRDAEQTRTDLDSLLGESAPMRELKAMLRQVLNAERQLRDDDAPAVLVLGETGTGKELVARALHYNGPRRDKPFVELNCASIPAQLLESELFGHERGAFTDARERKLGLVETAEGGTLFLDEIGDMEAGLQAKLLRLLEEKTVRRVGSLRDQQVNVRIVAATHRSLESLVREKLFRADLYYRLRVVQLTLPPLRERGHDVLRLAEHFIDEHARRYGKATPMLTPAARNALERHSWPGNVRELRNVLEQSVLLCLDGRIDAGQLALSSNVADVVGASPGAGAATTLESMERQMLARALERTGWNVSRAARELGLSRDTLRYRIEKLKLSPEGSPG